MTLLTICEAALEEISDFTVPSTIVGNEDPTAVTLLALANRGGRNLAREYDWQILLKTYTFPTVASTETYALPSDFRKFAALTFWDRTNLYQVQGPVSPALYEAIRSGSLVGVGFTKYFRIAANLFSIRPVPTAAETIAYQYYSLNWVDNDADGDGDLPAFTADSQTAVFDEDLMALDLKWRFLRAKGWDYADEREEFDRQRDIMLAIDGGKDIISLGGPRINRTDGIPDTGIG